MLIIAVVNRHVIAKNRKNGQAEHPIRVSRGKYGKPTYTSCLEFAGRGRLIYSPSRPLPCGASLWMELFDDD